MGNTFEQSEERSSIKQSAMRVSVAMCTYNGERYLAEQLRSIRQQTYVPMELVVCDDGSTDGTAALVEDFRRSVGFPVRWHRNATNLGSTRNFAQAIALCTGDAIALCDQDDRWMPEKLAVCVAALQADSAVAGVFSNARLMDENGTLLPSDLWSRVRFSVAGQEEFRKNGARYLGRRDTVTGAALVFRAAYVHQVLPPPVEWVHDGWIAFVLASVARLQALPQHLMTYRLHERQQVGATVVPLHTHLHTDADAALAFHRGMVRRFSLLGEHMDVLAAQGIGVNRAARGEVDRRIRFEQSRTDLLLQQHRMNRVWPALLLLQDYRHYEKGVLSLLRDVTHKTVPQTSA